MGGALAPELTTFGSDLELSVIKLEPSTTDGRVFDPLTMAVPGILGDTVILAVYGLQFAGRNTLCVFLAPVRSSQSLTYRSQDTHTAGALLRLTVGAPLDSEFLQGISTALSAGYALADGAILSETALRISIHSEMRASVSTQIAARRNILFSSSAPGPWSHVKAVRIILI
ncbi:hypothetical protein FB451DRAFT_1533324 [Mycena latifolia]|nr:hypothetical protein FB451DRAFT_1533324 [Mycena latifolia]